MNRNRLPAALLVALALVVVSLGAARTGAQTPLIAEVPLGSGFSYQGRLTRGGSAATALCDFQFGLWDAATEGTQVGTTQSASEVQVREGLFTVTLDFGGVFDGAGRWLGTAVRCAGDPEFTPLNPRQPLTAAPYALSLRPGAVINGGGVGTSATALRVNNSAGIGLFSSGGARAGILGSTSDLNGSGVEGNASGSNAAGVFGLNTSGPGVWGRGTAGGSGVFGQSSGYAVYGASTGGFGVYGTSSNAGVVGVGYVGMQGVASGTADSQGVRGEDGANGAGANRYAAVFVGRVLVAGTLAKSAGSFKIDHPLDPENKYLSHSFVESPDMKNIYDGVAVLGADGTAVVQLPDYFEALNMEFRYQLTCIGGYAPVYIAEEISGNRFTIAGGTPDLKISWQVTGTRHDPYANANRIQVEELKAPQDQGRYLYPAGYGEGPDMGVGLLGGTEMPELVQPSGR